MTCAEELLRQMERMRAEGKTEKEVTAYVNREIAENNARELARLRVMDFVRDAVAI